MKRSTHVLVLCAMVAIALPVLAKEKGEGKAKADRAKPAPVTGQVDRVQVNGDQIEWTIAGDEGETRATMSANVIAMCKEGGTQVNALRPAGKKAPQGKAGLRNGTITQASVKGQTIHLTLNADGEPVELTMPTRVKAMARNNMFMAIMAQRGNDGSKAKGKAKARGKKADGDDKPKKKGKGKKKQKDDDNGGEDF